MSKNNMLEMQSFYTGSQKQRGMLERQGIKRHLIKPVTKTTTTYIESHIFDEENYPGSIHIARECIYFYPNDHSVITIGFGQKMKFATDRIFFIGDADLYLTGKRGSTTVIRVCYNVKRGKSTNKMNEKYNRQYWEDYERELERELLTNYSEY